MELWNLFTITSPSVCRDENCFCEKFHFPTLRGRRLESVKSRRSRRRRKSTTNDASRWAIFNRNQSSLMRPDHDWKICFYRSGVRRFLPIQSNRPPSNNDHHFWGPICNFYNIKLPLKNGHKFMFPRLVVVHRFDCACKLERCVFLSFCN